MTDVKPFLMERLFLSLFSGLSLISQSIIIPLSNFTIQLSIIWHRMFSGTVWSSMISRWLSSFKRKIWKLRLSCRSATKTCEDLGIGRASCPDWFSLWCQQPGQGRGLSLHLFLWFLSLLDYKSYSDYPIVSFELKKLSLLLEYFTRFWDMWFLVWTQHSSLMTLSHLVHLSDSVFLTCTGGRWSLSPLPPGLLGGIERNTGCQRTLWGLLGSFIVS